MRVPPLLRKLLRDLLGQKSQVLAIALVMACGMATLIMARGTLNGLITTREAFYRQFGFGDVFLSLKRAPLRAIEDLRRWPGVRQVDVRVQSPARLELPDFDDPVRGFVLGLPERRDVGLNRVYLRAGRWPDPRADDEVLVTEGFAVAQQLHPGDQFTLRVHGRSTRVRIVGIALSPEFVYQLEAGAAFPDFKRFAVLWMSAEPLARALDLDGAFNQLSLDLAPGTDPASLLERLDRHFARYGGLGALARADQLSHKFLTVQFDQLKVLSTMLPTVFLAVAAFLLHVVLGRLISAQREQVALLKAFGYSGRQIAAHYALWVAAIVLLGGVMGCLLGNWLGEQLMVMYRRFYRFPQLDYAFDPRVALLSFGIAALVAYIGAAQALRSVLQLAPATAMRPPAPLRFRRAWLERCLPRRFATLERRMRLRQLERHPLRSGLSIAGIALACAVLMISVFQNGAFTRMVDQQFGLAQRNDLAVYFYEPKALAVLDSLRAIPGVRRVEAVRSEVVWLRHGEQAKRVRLEGYSRGTQLKRLLSHGGGLDPVPRHGIALTADLAAKLGARIGDRLAVEALSGRRAHFTVLLTQTTPEPIGQTGMLNLDALNRLLGDGAACSGALLDIDPEQESAVYDRLERFAGIASIGSRSISIRNFYDTLADALLSFTYIATVLATVIALGVLYNSARVMLTERAREIATLRVLGYQRDAAARVLTAELWTLTWLGLPAGLITGLALCHVLVAGMTNDLMRVPAYITGGTFAAALGVVLLACLLAAWDLRRRVAQLDPVHALKVRE